MIRTKLITIGVVAALLAICSATQANQWEHQSSPWQEVPDPGWALNYPTGMAWVLGPDGSTIRSPVETPQPTELTWSIVPGGVAHWLDPTRLTRLSYSKIRTCLISTAYVNSLNRYQDLTLYQYSGEINIENFFQAHF